MPPNPIPRPGWLLRQFESAQRDVGYLPDYMRGEKRIPELDSVHESYKNAGLFFGVLSSELKFGWVTMEIMAGKVFFEWRFKINNGYAFVKRAVSLHQFHLTKRHPSDWARDVAKEMRDSMLVEHPEEIPKEAANV